MSLFLPSCSVFFSSHLYQCSGILNSHASFLPVDIMPAFSVVGLFNVKLSHWRHAYTSVRLEQQAADMSKNAEKHRLALWLVASAAMCETVWMFMATVHGYRMFMATVIHHCVS